MDEIEKFASFIYTLIYVSVFDYDDYYNKLFKNAIKYGMSRNEFWYICEWKEYFIYEEAYIEKMHEQAHIQGFYSFIALNTSLSNAFKKKEDKAVEYPSENMLTQQKKVIETKVIKEKITKENLQSVYMNRLANCY